MTLLRLAAAFGLLAAVAVRPALSQPQPLAQMDHSMWTARDGAPQGVLALAQAGDGTLWIGSEAGLFNFDGRNFTAFESPPGEPSLPVAPVYSVYVDRDNALWVTFLHAGVARISRTHVTLFDKCDEHQLSFVRNLTQAADGSIWGLDLQRYLVRFGADGQWHREPSPEPKARIGAFFIDSSNTLWVPQMGDHLYRRPLAQASYIATDAPTSIVFDLTGAHDGSIWMVDVIGDKEIARTQHIDRSGHLLQTMSPPDLPYIVQVAPDDSVIIATQSDGLRRMTFGNPPQVDAYTAKDGLSSDELHATLVDVDGNIWIGSRRGLDRFKQGRLIQFDPRVGEDWAICSDNAGSLWVTFDQLYKVSGGKTSVADSRTFYAIQCGRDGDLWLAGASGLWHLHADAMTHIPGVPGAPPWSVGGLYPTSDHTLYAPMGASGGGGFWQYKDNQWSKVVREGTLGSPGSVSYIDSHDRLWKGYGAGLVGLPLENRLFKTGDPGLGVVRDIRETSYGIVAAGANGIAINRDDHFQMLTFADDASAKGIAGIVESREGDLWLNAIHGIVRLGASELRTGIDKPNYKMKTDVLTQGDFVGAPQTSADKTTATRDAQGNLWFVTVNGVVHLDPTHWQTTRRPPILSITSLSVDRVAVEALQNIAPHPESLEIHYLGVNLTAPDQVVYKYRLSGLDDDWQEVGHRTTAIYTHLPAGKYAFQVMASNGDGIWTSPQATESFRVLPSFYQTTWFAVLAGCAALAIVWLAFRARLRAITREVRARAEERADERIRIARDLHDTLLQGVQGLLLTFHVAAQRVAADDESKMMLEKALASADAIIIEGRNRVTGLRSEHFTDEELMGSLRNAGEDLQPKRRILFHATRTGGNAKLKSRVADEVFYVAREALTNAFRHSAAARIDLTLDYGRRYFSVRCHDDGQGFVEAVGDKPGHWGLKGMRERVHSLGGTFSCRSDPRRGTVIVISLPGYRAYQDYSRLLFYWRALNLVDRDPTRRY
jgi:signal transduction histidine kinase/ligand-binding sensor domain-containing protein